MEPPSSASKPAPATAPLAELLASLQRQRSTCVVHVRDRFFEGDLQVEGGSVRATRFGALRGAAAVAAMMITEELQCRIISATPARSDPPEDTMTLGDSDSDEFVLEGVSEGWAYEPPEFERGPWSGLGEPSVALVQQARSLALIEPRGPRATSLAIASAGSKEDDPARTTLLGLESSLHAEASGGSEQRHEIPPVPFRSSRSVPDDLEGWAARANRASELPPAARKSVDRASLSFGVEARGSSARERKEAPASVTAQRSVIPATFSRERISHVWIAVALFAPLLLAAMFWGAQSEQPVVSTPAVTNKEPIQPPSLATGAPPTVKSGGLAPTVLLRVLVAEDGKVKTASVLAPRPGLGVLEKQAAETARGYRFRPATQGGHPIEQWVTMPLGFLPAPGAREFTVKGSDTMGATLGPGWARAFEAKEQGLRITVEALGSSTAFVGLLDGSAAVGLSSRPIAEAERSFAERLGVQLREVVAAYDGVAVIVHPENPLRSLDLMSVARIFSQQTKRWSELRGADAPVRTIGRPSYSGTHAFFQERLLAAHGPGAAFGPSVESIEASKEIATQVASDVNAIGYVGIGYLDPSVRALAISEDAAGPVVTPTPDTIRDGSYPIARPLYVYLRADSGHDARAWVDHALSTEGQAIVARNGFVPINSPVSSALASEVYAAHVAPPELIRVYFDPSSAAIESSSHTELIAAAAALRAGKRALVIGHSDSAGTAEANELLAYQRAQAVYAQLRQHGNSAAAIEVEVAAANHPLASNATADGRRANRRVDIVIVGERSTQ